MASPSCSTSVSTAPVHPPFSQGDGNHALELVPDSSEAEDRGAWILPVADTVGKRLVRLSIRWRDGLVLDERASLVLMDEGGQAYRPFTFCRRTSPSSTWYFVLPAETRMVRLEPRDMPATSALPTCSETLYAIFGVSFIEEILKCGEFDEKSVAFLRALSYEDIEPWRHIGDQWFWNYLLNRWEYAHRKISLQTYPWQIYLPISDSCNARCEFCTSWLGRSKYMTAANVQDFSQVLANAKCIDLCGYGEPLSNPEFEDIVHQLDGCVDPRCQFTLFTNGALLHRWVDRLLGLGVNIFNISINAATAATHDAVMGLGPKTFDRILDSIRYLVSKQKSLGILVFVSFVPTSTNMHEAADFIRLFDEIGVSGIFMRVLQHMDTLPPGLNYHTLSPVLRPDFEEEKQRAVEAIAQCRCDVYASPENWSLPILPPSVVEEAAAHPPALLSRSMALDSSRTWPEPVHDDTEPPIHAADPNPFRRSAPFDCTYPYYNLLLNRTQYLVTPCCYMRQIGEQAPVYMKSDQDFFQVWNGPAFTHLRRSLTQGPLLARCQLCPENR
ncbi:radical SAM protein [Azospirillum palustre]|nr:radical SAM protein [Azospirillum palustre]